MRQEGDRDRRETGSEPVELDADPVGWAPVPGPDGDATGEPGAAAVGEAPDEHLSGEDVTEGETIAKIEAAFPYVWAAILLLVCLIGIYFSVSNLPK